MLLKRYGLNLLSKWQLLSPSDWTQDGATESTSFCLPIFSQIYFGCFLNVFPLMVFRQWAMGTRLRAPRRIGEAGLHFTVGLGIPWCRLVMIPCEIKASVPRQHGFDGARSRCCLHEPEKWGNYCTIQNNTHSWAEQLIFLNVEPPCFKAKQWIWG